RERKRLDRQGSNGCDLPPAEQGLRRSGVERPPLRAPPRARGAAPGRDADREGRRGRRGHRRQRRLVGRRGPGAVGDRRASARAGRGGCIAMATTESMTAATRLPGPPELLPGKPDAVIDLQTTDGVALV